MGMRVQAAQQLRDGLRQQGLSTADLDKVLQQLKDIEAGTGKVQPALLDKMQADAIDNLKRFEYSLFRQFGIGGSKQPAMGSHADVPPEYRALVEEYYRQISKKGGQ